MGPRGEGQRDEFGFLGLFERSLAGFEERLRLVEQLTTRLEQELKSLKEDRCDVHAESLKELYESRNEGKLQTMGLTSAQESYKALWDAVDRSLANLKDRAASVDGQLAQLMEAKKDSKEGRLMLYSALISAALSLAVGVAVYYLTT